MFMTLLLCCAVLLLFFTSILTSHRSLGRAWITSLTSKEEPLELSESDLSRFRKTIEVARPRPRFWGAAG